MQEIQKDIRPILEGMVPRPEAICCTTNNVVTDTGLVMGAGIAKVFKEVFPHLPITWGARVLVNAKRYGDKCNGLICSRVPNYSGTAKMCDILYLIALPTKNHWKDPSSLPLIEQSLKSLVKLTNYMGWSDVWLPRPGCLNGGLSWEKQVKPLCEKHLDNRFTVFYQ